jgi:hypothetical protein
MFEGRRLPSERRGCRAARTCGSQGRRRRDAGDSATASVAVLPSAASRHAVRVPDTSRFRRQPRDPATRHSRLRHATARPCRARRSRLRHATARPCRAVHGSVAHACATLRGRERNGPPPVTIQFNDTSYTYLTGCRLDSRRLQQPQLEQQQPQLLGLRQGHHAGRFRGLLQAQTKPLRPAHQPASMVRHPGWRPARVRPPARSTPASLRTRHALSSSACMWTTACLWRQNRTAMISSASYAASTARTASPR